ncbi:protein phosphatase [Polaromonas sp.]|nr:protein phosphatase [Polaromonas sp.]
MITYEICACTDTGLVRKNNEDAIGFDAACGLCILADGMGGYNAGEVASDMAVTFITAELGSWLLQKKAHQTSAKDVWQIMESAVENANHAIYNAAHTNPNYADMGTTLVVAVVQDNRLLLGHIGDSRCYRLRGLTLEQITKDHSLLQEQIDDGLITAEMAKASIYKNLITRAVGVEEGVPLECNEFCVLPGDIYLMCSDGLSDLVSPQDIALILLSEQPLNEKSHLLVAAANAGGGRDNISVVLIQASPPAPPAKHGLLYKVLGK